MHRMGACKRDRKGYGIYGFSPTTLTVGLVNYPLSSRLRRSQKVFNGVFFGLSPKNTPLKTKRARAAGQNAEKNAHSQALTVKA